MVIEPKSHIALSILAISHIIRHKKSKVFSFSLFLVFVAIVGLGYQCELCDRIWTNFSSPKISLCCSIATCSHYILGDRYSFKPLIPTVAVRICFKKPCDIWVKAFHTHFLLCLFIVNDFFFIISIITFVYFQFSFVVQSSFC